MISERTMPDDILEDNDKLHFRGKCQMTFKRKMPDDILEDNAR